MRVKELIEKLKLVPENAEVEIGGVGDYAPMIEISVLKSGDHTFCLIQEY